MEGEDPCNNNIQRLWKIILYFPVSSWIPQPGHEVLYCVACHVLYCLRSPHPHKSLQLAWVMTSAHTVPCIRNKCSLKPSFQGFKHSNRRQQQHFNYSGFQVFPIHWVTSEFIQFNYIVMIKPSKHYSCKIRLVPVCLFTKHKNILKMSFAYGQRFLNLYSRVCVCYTCIFAGVTSDY